MNSGFPFDQIRDCSACSMRTGCSGPVPGVGPVPAKVMLLGEAPGVQEDQFGEPFVGKAGRFLQSLLSSFGYSKSQCFVTNVLKCRPPNNATPTASQIAGCSRWLDIELKLVQPEIVMLMGATAINRVLGYGAGTVEHLHGIPVVQPGRILLPAYHPAAGLYEETSQLRHIYDDFRVLAGLIAGKDPSDYISIDEFPDPDYTGITDEKHLSWLYGVMEAAVACGSPIAADVETVNDKLWSIQVCITPGTAYFIGPELADKFRFPPTAKVVFHNYLYDYKFTPVADFGDTMVMAYQLGLPQGLKELSSRLCGMKMRSYSDLTSGAGREKSVAYLVKASGMDWPKPEPVTEFKWDNKEGGLVNKVRNPQPIARKIKRILDDMAKDESVDPVKRWQSIEDVERVCVEKELGAMPTSTIADIPRESAVKYACRDADATLRVYRKMLPMIREYGLEFILGIDLSALPVIQEMMDTGFALNIDHLKELSAEYAGKMGEVAKEAAEIAGHPFNPGSSDQVANVVYTELKFPVTRKTDTGKPSTDDRELKKINHPVVKPILKYRQIAKNKDSFADALLERAVQHDGHYRIHTTLKATRTETGRLSSSDPNLQAMPTRTKEGKRIRKGFVATR